MSNVATFDATLEVWVREQQSLSERGEQVIGFQAQAGARKQARLEAE
jgi:hypothetical protein